MKSIDGFLAVNKLMQSLLLEEAERNIEPWIKATNGHFKGTGDGAVLEGTPIVKGVAVHMTKRTEDVQFMINYIMETKSIPLNIAIFDVYIKLFEVIAKSEVYNLRLSHGHSTRASNLRFPKYD